MRYLFGIITNGKRPDKLQALVDSIRAAGAGDYEIVIAGEIANVPDGVKFIEMLDAARTGRLGAMRNALCESSEAEIFIILDDDMVLDAAFIKELEAFGDDWDVLCTRMLNPDGTRNWDWCTYGGQRGHYLMDYTETDPFVYVSGGRIVMKRWVFEKAKWDGQRGFYQSEDIDFTQKLQRAGVRITMNPRMTMTHDDHRYTQNGKGVCRVSN